MTQIVQIPVIDVSGSQPEAEVAKALVDAAATYGFVYVKNEGKDIPVAVIDRMFKLSKNFFNSPVAEKEKCKITQTNNGWVGMHAETLGKGQRVGDFKEAFNIGPFEEGKPTQLLPSALEAHAAEIERFQKYCMDLVLKLLTLFSIGLEIPASEGGPSYLPSRHTNGATRSTLRLLYYPSISRSNSPNTPQATDVRAGAHSDYGSLTLLFQRPGQPGLEILPPPETSSTSSSEFIPVQIQPPGTAGDPSPPILVNIGDVLSYWTNGLLRSTVHRVVFPLDPSANTSAPESGVKAADRYSMAYFAHPVGTTVLEAVPGERVRIAGEGKEGEKKGEIITADEHLMGRLRDTYGGLYKDEGWKV